MKNVNLSRIRNYMNFRHGFYGEKSYRKAAVMALLIVVDQKPHFIFQERNKNIRQGGEVSFPGGGFDKELDFTLLDTAVRETVEEMGIKKESIEIWGQLDTLITQFDMIVEPFVGFSKTKIENFFPNEEEVSKIFSVPVEFFLENKPEWYDIVLKSSPIVIDPKTNEQKLIFPAKDLGLPEMYHNEWTTNVRKIPLYKTSDGVIWGFTAQVIINFVEKIIKF